MSAPEQLTHLTERTTTILRAVDLLCGGRLVTFAERYDVPLAHVQLWLTRSREVPPPALLKRVAADVRNHLKAVKRGR